MFFDSHVHSEVSPDSDMCPELAIKLLQKKNLGVTFTEHVDFATPASEGVDYNATDVPYGVYEFVCDLKRYPSDYKRRIRSNHALLGIEVGLSAAYLSRNTEVAGGGFDFVLGSIHRVEGKEIYYDFPNECGDYISRYLTYMQKMVELCGFFDSLAHIDYIARYDQDVANAFSYKNYASHFDAVFKTLIETDRVIEINTSRLGDNKLIQKLVPIYTRFVQLGGRYCTIGSDAHLPESVGRNFDKALWLAGESGMKVVYYKDRKRYLCD